MWFFSSKSLLFHTTYIISTTLCVGIRGHMGHIGILVVAVRRLSHSPMGIRTSKLLFFKLPRLKLPSSSRSYTEQYHTKLIRLSEACPRIPGGYPFIYRLVLARGYPRLAMFFYTVWSPPEAIHGLVAMFFYTVWSPPEAIHGLQAMLLYTVWSPPGAIHGLHLDPPLPSLRRHTSTA